MKRILTLGVVVVTLIYVFPFIYNDYYLKVSDAISQNPTDFLAERTSMVADSDDDDSKQENDGQTATIKALIDGEVKEMSLETYIMGVVCAEVPASFPEEAIKAQAVAARTYVMYKKQHNASDATHKGAEVCSDYTHCTAYKDIEAQASSMWGDKSDTYYNKIKKAVEDTAGEILTYENQPIISVFHSASSAFTESSQDVWGSSIPYLVSVSSAGGEACSKYTGSVTVSAEDFRTKMSAEYPGIYLKAAPNTWFTASKRSKAGGIISATVGGKTVKGSDIRTLFNLNSTNFKLETTDDSITFITTGYGHGVGLSQYGAKKMSEDGSSYKEILAHYYTNTKLDKIAEDS